MLKFLSDENVSLRVIAGLVKIGYDVASVNQIRTGLSDEQIFSIAAKENRIILTHDKDFGNILKYPLKRHKGVILIRLNNQSPANVFNYLTFLIASQKTKLKNSLVVLNENGIRFYRNSSG